jgi:aminotransferase
VLQEVGFTFTMPEGAYYIFADFSQISRKDDVSFAKWMAEEVGVATVPGSSFYHDKTHGAKYVRFAFCKKFETMKRAAERMADLPRYLAV